MKTIVLDLETIPSQKPGALMDIRKTIQPPGTMSKPETIAKWMTENAYSAAEEKWRKTALNGSLGEIICIGYAIEDEQPQSIHRQLGAPEAELLQHFYENMVAEGVTPIHTIVGHNVKDFDLRFLFQRSVINKVKPSIELHTGSRYSGDYVYDTMLSWAGWGNRISLSNLCAALCIPVKENGITGATVWDAVNEGRIEEVGEYCRQDVEATRAVYRKMNFLEV